MKKKADLNKSNISRRDFFRNASVGAGGILLSSLPVSVSAHVAGSGKIKIALIGCGKRGAGAVNQALKTGDDVQLVAMADVFQDKIDESYEILSQIYVETDKLNVPEEHKFIGFDSYKKAISLADVVILATPPGFRPMHFEAAVDAGKHVFMEKPVATDAPGVRQVLKAGRKAKDKNLNVVVGLQRRYQDNYREVYKRLKEGEIGDIISGQIYWNGNGVWMGDRLPGHSEMEYQMRNWYYFVWLCGDHILEQHIHQIDVANWFIGEYPDSAQGMGGREVRTGPDYGEIFDHHFVEFTYPSGAVIASQCRHQRGCWNNVAEVFQGTKGTVNTNSKQDGIIKDYKGKIRYEHQGMEDPNPYQQEHDELFAAIRKGNVINDAEYGAKSTLAALMGRMATYSGQIIERELALNSNISLIPENLSWDVNPPTMPDENDRYAIPVPGKTIVI